MLTAFYCLGLGIPFVLIALGINRITGILGFLRRHTRAINVLGGVFLVTIGLLMVTGVWSVWIYQLQAVMGGIELPI